MISFTRTFILTDGTPIELHGKYSPGCWEFRPFHLQGSALVPLGWLVATIRQIDELLPYAEQIKPDNRSLFINDFILRTRGKGLGSAMLQILAEMGSTETPVSRIEGSISYTDWEHVDQLEQFYTRQGYTVVLDRFNHSGSISKQLTTAVQD